MPHEDKDLLLNDISDELLILNKTTIDTLFKLENCSDCIALYVFYYKTAKWQKTNTIKANDTYIRNSLNWGADKIRRTKQLLKENGLIDIVQNRENGKIQGWYIKISYLVTQKRTEDIKIKVEESNNTQNQQVVNPTSGFEDTNALKEYIICLKKEIEVLKGKKQKKSESFISPTLEQIQEYCKQRKNNIDPQKFYDYFNASGWVDSKGNKVKNWKQKIITWETNTNNNTNNKSTNDEINYNLKQVSKNAFQL